MDGGLDGVIKSHFGPAIERKVQAEIRRLYGGLLPVGHGTCVPTGKARPAFLISTPTMTDPPRTSAIRSTWRWPARGVPGGAHAERPRAGQYQSVALPGLGAQTGRVPEEICAT